MTKSCSVGENVTIKSNVLHHCRTPNMYTTVQRFGVNMILFNKDALKAQYVDFSQLEVAYT